MMTATSPARAFEGGQQPDEEIIRQVLAGNTGMFELLMRRYNERVYRAARAIVRDEQEAEDIMQTGICQCLHAPAAVQRRGAILDMVDENCGQ